MSSVPSNEEVRSSVSSYSDAGVSIEQGDEAVSRYAPIAKATYDENVISGIGGFASLYRLDQGKYKAPVLVSATDGVGTKLELARLAGRYDSVGYDLVAMVLDDLSCTGATPLFMLDYLSVGKLNPDVVEQLVAGIARAASECGCALIGGETAEHPGIMSKDGIDVAGFAVGVVERSEMWGSHRVVSGDALIALASPNARSNGFSLIRSVLATELASDPLQVAWEGDSRSLIDALLEPSVLYTPTLADSELRSGIHAAAHVTGGGLLANLARVIPAGQVALVDRHSWPIPQVFHVVKERGAIAWSEMDRVFNLGVGMVLVVAESARDATVSRLAELGVASLQIGSIAEARFVDEGIGARWNQES